MYKQLLPVILICGFAFGFSELKITPETASRGDEITVSGKFAEGATSMDVTVFVDINDNDAFDQGTDFLYFQGTAPFGPDEDGLFSITFKVGDEYEDPFSTPGKWVFIIGDIGGADTASALIKEKVTDQYIAGSVKGPDGEPLASVIVGADFDDEKYNVITKADGSFKIYFPDEALGRMVYVEVDDLGELYNHLLPADPFDFIFDESVDGIELRFTTPQNFVKIKVVDESGKVVPDILVEIYSLENQFDRAATSDSKGFLTLAVAPGLYGIEGDDWDNQDFMFSTIDIDIEGDADTTHVEYRIHSTDKKISGTITSPVGTINFPNSFDIGAVMHQGDTYYRVTGTVNSNGTFSINVSSQFSEYGVWVWAMLPEGYEYSPEGFEDVAPGTDTLKIVITVDPARAVRTAMNPSPTHRIQLTGSAAALTINSTVPLLDGVVSVYTLTGRKVFSESMKGTHLRISRPLAAGTYQVVITEKGRLLSSRSFIARR